MEWIVKAESLSDFVDHGRYTISTKTLIHCRECEYGEQDEDGWWFCRSFGCQVGDMDGSGFCSDAERKNNV